MKTIFAAQLLKVASRTDRSYALTFSTRELRGVDAAQLLGNLMDEGWLIWSPNEDITEADVPDEKADAMTGQKTQAQRMRGVIFKLWEQGGSKGDFMTYYTQVTEHLINQLKERLDS